MKTNFHPHPHGATHRIQFRTQREANKKLKSLQVSIHHAKASPFREVGAGGVNWVVEKEEKELSRQLFGSQFAK